MASEWCWDELVLGDAMMQITLDGKRKRLGTNPKTAGLLLRALGLSPEETLVKVGGNVVIEGAALAKGKRIEVIRVVFGG